MQVEPSPPPGFHLVPGLRTFSIVLPVSVKKMVNDLLIRFL